MTWKHAQSYHSQKGTRKRSRRREQAVFVLRLLDVSAAGRMKKMTICTKSSKLKPNPRQPIGTHSNETESWNMKSPHWRLRVKRNSGTLLLDSGWRPEEGDEMMTKMRAVEPDMTLMLILAFSKGWRTTLLPGRLDTWPSVTPAGTETQTFALPDSLRSTRENSSFRTWRVFRSKRWWPQGWSSGPYSGCSSSQLANENFFWPWLQIKKIKNTTVIINHTFQHKNNQTFRWVKPGKNRQCLSCSWRSLTVMLHLCCTFYCSICNACRKSATDALLVNLSRLSVIQLIYTKHPVAQWLTGKLNASRHTRK